MHKYIKNKQIVLGILFFISLFFLTGCGKKLGYDINKEKNEVIWRTWDTGHSTQEKVVQNADAATFNVLNFKPVFGGKKNGFAKDKNHVYLQGKVIPKADPQTFKGFDNNLYRDANHIFILDSMLGLVPIENSDPETFQLINTINEAWFKDAKRVYYYKNGFVPQEISSFELLGLFWARDSKAYYFCTREVPGIDRETFTIFNDTLDHFAKDKNTIYYMGWPVKECDVKTFICKKNGKTQDSQYRYSFLDRGSGDFWMQKFKLNKRLLKNAK